MAIMALSIVGMYNHDSSIFDGFTIPSGLDRDASIADILFNCAELELLYQDFNFMKDQIKFWSKKNKDVWQKLYNTTQLEYNPIWNVDGEVTETEERDLTGTDDSMSEKGENRKRIGAEERTDNRMVDIEGTTSGTLDHEVMGYNSSAGYQPESKDTQAGKESSGTKDNDSIKAEYGDTEESISAEQGKRTTTDTGTIKRKTVRTGNIGVTMTQQLIEAEREVDKFNLYDIITKSFKDTFCVLVY